MTSCWKSQSWFRSLGGEVAVCFMSSLEHGAVIRLLFFPSGYLFSNVSTVDMCCSYPNRSKQGKLYTYIYMCVLSEIIGKVRLLFWQEMAYLENREGSMRRSGSSCDWPAITKQLEGDFFCERSRTLVIPSSHCWWFDDLAEVWVVWFHGIHK